MPAPRGHSVPKPSVLRGFYSFVGTSTTLLYHTLQNCTWGRFAGGLCMHQGQLLMENCRIRAELPCCNLFLPFPARSHACSGLVSALVWAHGEKNTCSLGILASTTDRQSLPPAHSQQQHLPGYFPFFKPFHPALAGIFGEAAERSAQPAAVSTRRSSSSSSSSPAAARASAAGECELTLWEGAADAPE